MMTSNNALVPDPDKDDILASEATDWPFQHLGLRMCGWGENQVKYYLLGTPVIWWGSSISLIVAGFAMVYYLMRMQRQYKDWLPGAFCSDGVGLDMTDLDAFLQVNGRITSTSVRSRFTDGCSIIVSFPPPDLQTAVLADVYSSSVPFLVMGRVTYLHHYVSSSFPYTSCSTPNQPRTSSFPHCGSQSSWLGTCWTPSSSQIPNLQSLLDL